MRSPLLSFCFILFLLLSGSATLAAQVDTTNPKAVKLAKKKLVYYWVGNACPYYDAPVTKHGFRIVCVGCITRLRYIIHNRRVVRKINRVYGKNWFQENYRRS
ncbi:MAG TPA: hypothetical protein VK826_06335 [Bacteroidia bacterium]|nr:hypothetical protein [Bacteroidia bacterium]